ncbi:hypothetical protein IMG5_181870 [Ichthyophthirius multifiliis]|uniref:Intraflagellar transport protein 46 homolog n=1 Tax=Ichthyophthirius multifiliis TaxID=5932 RepID=G0R2Y9_ICHMU|nr:hypothetical protein IMG5_181870 [Ichthyophthirius multifiliis]EGR28165.1 hypothetical protein IMG5_181870 [Ichthyophthirius multifiliis]|eukprot:XP_004027510.1 hypothetical protein IMG5_181870 [Ichthyophthirius multifiliis]
MSDQNLMDKAKIQKIDNQHIDEAVDLDSDGQSEDIESHDEPENKDNNILKTQQKSQQQGQEKQLSEEDLKPPQIVGAYNPSDYAHLDVNNEIKELFKYVQRYQPINMQLQSKLRPFIPEYYPAVGEVDAFLKMARPDQQEEQLGLHILDEPALNQSNRPVIDLMYKELVKKKKDDKSITIHSIENAEKNPKEIQLWINNVAQIRKKKQPPSVSYTKQMPDIDTLMQVWPQEIEDALSNFKIPSEELDLNLMDYSKLACAILDIPVHNTSNNTNVIESLHVLFTLYSEFKANQHFQQNKDQQYEQNQLQINQ